ncbi:MAG: hypothetical protein ACYCO5_02450 [Acidobacteriaceae bacterium]
MAMLRGAAIQAERAWQGLIQPFVRDADAKLVLRALAADSAVDVAAGRITAPWEIQHHKPHDAEFRMKNCSAVFDILVLEFPVPAHPWVFSLSPVISERKFPSHPHLRSDRTLVLPSMELTGMCIYSAAEFQYGLTLPKIPQFLHQVAIYLAKHVIWLKTQRLLNAQTGAMVHDGLDLETLYKNLPVNSIWQKQPQLKTVWSGFWPGKEAKSGRNHLSLDPERECWCGKGLAYRRCCQAEEIERYGLGSRSAA